MFNFTKKEIIKLANEYSYKKETLEKELRLIDILNFLNVDEDIRGKISLKGGTAINVTVFDLPRLSVDIDLDYIGSLMKEVMKNDRFLIKEKILKMMQENSYSFVNNKSKFTHALDSFVFNYNNSFGTTDLIKIEINYMDRIHIFDDEYRKSNISFITNVDILTLNKFDLFASKINALICRTTICN